MDKVRYFLYGLILSLTIFTYPVQAKYSCGGLDTILASSFSSDYIFLATAIIGKDTAAVVMFDRDGNFRIIGTDDKGDACVLLHGTEWQFAIEEIA